MDDLLPPGAEPGTVPTDLEQATGLERLEILGKMQGVDIFDMSPLDSSRKGMWNLFIVPFVKWKELNMLLGAEGRESSLWRESCGHTCIQKKR